MTEEDILAHSRSVKRLLAGLQPRQSFLVGLACLERQWRVFDAAVSGTRWEALDKHNLRRSIDWCWAKVAGVAGAEVPEPRSVLLDTCPDGPDSLTAAFYISQTVIDFVRSVGRSDPGHASYVALHALSRIETLQESCEAPVSQFAPLYEREMERQMRDVEFVRTNPNETGVTAARDRWQQEDLYDGMWFQHE